MSKKKKIVSKLEEDTVVLKEEIILEESENIISPADNLSYEVRSCADLYRMYKSDQLQIQPDFQRNFVWKPATQTYFIDSLAMGLPIPTIFISYDTNTGKRVVIDGLQRISTIIRFFEFDKWKLNKLPDIDQNLAGKSVAAIKKQSPKLYQRVENATIPVITIRSDLSLQSSVDTLFSIFHRLNTGGQKLNSQEIRNCIYSGKFNNMLKKVVNSDDWKEIMGISPVIDRLGDEEILLRVFCFMDSLDDYNGNLSKYLNHYMMEKKNISDAELEDKETMINSALSYLNGYIEDKMAVSQLGKTLKEALLVGVIKNVYHIANKTKGDFQAMFEMFIDDDEFKAENMKHGLAKKEKVQSRLAKAIDIFSE